jgi:hypothetical protein
VSHPSAVRAAATVILALVTTTRWADATAQRTARRFQEGRLDPSGAAA